MGEPDGDLRAPAGIEPTSSYGVDMKFTGVGVHLKARDLAASRRFYEGLLGMTPARASGNPNFRRTLASALPPSREDGLPGSPDRWNSISYRPCPNTEIELADSHPAVSDRSVFEAAIDGPKISAMLHVESLVPLIVDRKAELGYPVRIYPWGSVEAAVKDPDGFVVVLIARATEKEVSTLRSCVEVEVLDAAQS